MLGWWTPLRSVRPFDEVFDQAIVFHGFADYMRDYEVVWFPRNRGGFLMLLLG